MPKWFWWLLALALTTGGLLLPAPQWRTQPPQTTVRIHVTLVPEQTRKLPTQSTRPPDNPLPAPDSSSPRRQPPPARAAARRQPEAPTKSIPATTPEATTVSPAQLANILSSQTHFDLDVRVGGDFQARAHDLPNYRPPAMLARNWSPPVPGLDPDSDQPTQEIPFYDFGWQGNVERLMDAMITTSTHKLAYGTTVECLSVLGVSSLICAWGASDVNLSPDEQKRLTELYDSLHNQPQSPVTDKRPNSPPAELSRQPAATTNHNDPFNLKTRLRYIKPSVKQPLFRKKKSFLGD